MGFFLASYGIPWDPKLPHYAGLRIKGTAIEDIIIILFKAGGTALKWQRGMGNSRPILKSRIIKSYKKYLTG